MIFNNSLEVFCFIIVDVVWIQLSVGLFEALPELAASPARLGVPWAVVGAAGLAAIAPMASKYVPLLLAKARETFTCAKCKKFWTELRR